MPDKLNVFSNSRNTLVKIKKSGENLISIQTYDRTHGKSCRFLIIRESLQNHDFSQGPFWDTDCGNILRIYFHPVTRHLVFEIIWLHYRENGDVFGSKQHFSFNPGLGVLDNVDRGKDGSYLYKPVPRPRTMEFTRQAMQNIRELSKDKKTRRAFSKAMRSCFQWPDTHITLYSDGPRDFYFKTDDGLCGGLIRHEYGGRIAYSVHT